jgi:DNA-binding response OmpR family regulator
LQEGLPIPDTGPHEGRGTPAPSEAEPPPDIVLVESDIEVAAMIEFALNSAGHTIRMFNTGPEALDGLIALSRDGRQRLVILTVDLVGLDGHTLHEQLRLSCPHSYLVAFLSTRGSDADQIRALTGGAIDYLVKPVSLHVLIAKVGVWMTFCKNR